MPRRSDTPRRNSQDQEDSPRGRAQQRGIADSRSSSCTSLHGVGSSGSFRNGRSRSRGARGSAHGGNAHTTPRRSQSSTSLRRARASAAFFIPPTPPPTPRRRKRSHVDAHTRVGPSLSPHRTDATNCFLGQMKQYFCGIRNAPPSGYFTRWAPRPIGNAPYAWAQRFTNIALPTQSIAQHNILEMNRNRAYGRNLPTGTMCGPGGPGIHQLSGGTASAPSMLPPRLYQDHNMPANPTLSKQKPHPELEFLYNDAGDPDLSRSMFWTYTLIVLCIFTVAVFVVFLTL